MTKLLLADYTEKPAFIRPFTLFSSLLQIDMIHKTIIRACKLQRDKYASPGGRGLGSYPVSPPEGVALSCVLDNWAWLDRRGCGLEPGHEQLMG